MSKKKGKNSPQPYWVFNSTEKTIIYDKGLHQIVTSELFKYINTVIIAWKKTKIESNKGWLNYKKLPFNVM